MSFKRARPLLHCNCSHVAPLFLPPTSIPLPSRTPQKVCPSRLAVPARPSRRVFVASISASPNLVDVDDRIINAVSSLSRQPRVTVTDVAAAAGIDVTKTQDALVTLANLTGAAIDVTDAGTLAYRFPSDVRGKLRSNSFRAAVRMAWDKAFPTLFTVVRVSFGALLIISVVVTFVAIAALSSAARSDDERRNSRPSFLPVRFFAPDIFDIMFYARYRGYYQQERDPNEMSFLEAIYSFVFGDGNPNEGLEERRWRRVAATIRANRGAVTAEQLAPFLDPPAMQASDVIVDESFVLPALQRFQGHPEVTDSGDIIYVFPSFMETGARVGQLEFAGVGTRQGGLGSTLIEEELSLSRTPMGQRAMVVALGVVNVLGVLTLGAKLATVTAITPDAAALVGLIRSIYPALAVYAASFVFIPIVRWLRQRKMNEDIRRRNAAREQAAVVVARPGGDVRKKIRAAEKYAQGVRVVKKEDVVYSSDKDLLDQRAVQENVLDDFDRRLGS